MDRQKFIYVNSYVRSKLSLSYFPLLFFTIFLDKLNRRLKQIYEQIDIFKHMMHTWFFLSIVSKAKKIYTFRWNRIEFIHDAWYRGRASVQGRNMAVSGSRATRIDVTTFLMRIPRFYSSNIFRKKKKKKETKEKRLYSHRFFIIFPLIGRLYSNSKYSSRCKKQE